MRALALARVNLTRLFRTRSNYFFVFLFPMLLILAIGATFGGNFDARLGVAAEGEGAFQRELVAGLERLDDVEVERLDTAEDLLDAVERGRVQAGLTIPADYDRQLGAGREVTLEYLSRPGLTGQQLRQTVDSVVGAQAALLKAARFAEAEGAADLGRALTLARVVSTRVPGVDVEVRAAGEALFPEDLGRFDLGASTQLLLFLFVTALTSSQALIETRKWGLSRRMLATPTSTATVIAGEGLGRLLIAMVQAAVIILGALVVFDVNWGDPLGAAAIVAAFALVGTGAGLLLGATLSNEQQAGGVSLLIGLGLAALGGSMAPLEIFSDTMRTVAHVTPHAWANDAFAELVRRDGTIADILPELGILLAYAAVLLALAAFSLRRVISR